VYDSRIIVTSSVMCKYTLAFRYKCERLCKFNEQAYDHLRTKREERETCTKDQRQISSRRWKHI